MKINIIPQKTLFILLTNFLFIQNIFAQNVIDSLKKLEIESNSNEKIPILIELARNYYINDDFIESENSCKKALEISRNNHDSKSEVDILNTLAYICSYYEPARVESLCDSAYILSEKSVYEKGKLESLIIRARVIKNNNPTKALELLRQALKTTDKLNFKELTANAKALSGEIYRSIGNYLESTKYYLDAYKLYDEILDNKPTRFNKYLYGSLLNNLGITYKKLNNNEEALKYYEEYLVISIETDDSWGKASCYNNLGNLKMKSNEDKSDEDKSDEALLYYSLAVEELKKLGSERSMADVFLNMAIIYSSKNDNDRALRLFNKSMKIFDKNNDSIGIARVLVNLGDYWLESGEPEKAEENFFQALSIVESQNERSLYMDICEKLSIVNEKLGRFDAALSFYKDYTALKDTILNAGKAQEVGTMTANFENERKISEEHRKEEIDSRNEQRKHLLEYFGITIFIIILFTILMLLPRFGIKTTTIESMVFVAFLLTFEFLNALLNPVQDMISEGDPIILFGTNIVIALSFTPLDTYLEKILRKRGVSRKS